MATFPRYAEQLEDRTLLAATDLVSAIAPLWFQAVEPSTRPPVLTTTIADTSSTAAIASVSDGSTATAAEVTQTAVDGQNWIVQFRRDAVHEMTSVAQTSSLLADGTVSFQIIRGLGSEGEVLVGTWGASDEVVAGWLASNSNVVSFSQDMLIQVGAVPNDPSFSSLWGLNNTGQSGGTVDADIDAPEAWNVTTGSSSIVVAVIDTGIDYNHPDLAANIWTNPGEIAGNGIDDDGNGFIDDVNGWDFANNDANPMDDNNHGTHVAGTIGATGNNNVGVVGINWQIDLMALKFLDASGNGFTSNATLAVNYATMMRERGINVRVTNNSWSGGGFSQSLYNAIAASRDEGILFVAAAGNGGSDNIGDNNDSVPSYPSNYDLDNVIAVAATNRNDSLDGYSNYGATTVDLAAPGTGILSTTRNNSYSTFNGTSMATPHVVGVAALAWSLAPDANYQQIRSAILAGVDTIPSLTGKVATGGRLNANKTLTALLQSETATPSGYLAAATNFQSIDLIPGSAGVLTVVDGGNDSAAAINLGGNSFTFYGQNYTGATALYVSSNGLITFGSGNSTASNTDLTTAPTQAAIAPFWDDLRTDVDSNDRVLAKFEDTTGDGVADRLIIEWNLVSHAPSSPSTVTFQTILQLNSGSADGSIVFNYVDLDFGDATINNGSSATVGIKDTGTQGLNRLLVAQNNGVHPLIASGRAILLDRTRPGGDVVDVSPDPQTTAVSSIDITFTESIDPASFDYRDITLTLNGGANLITSAVTISFVSGTTWRINGLAGLTSSDGTYVLTVNLTGITDSVGHSGLGSTSDSWTMNAGTSTPPDIRLLTATADGGSLLSLTYAIDNAAATPFSVGFYRSDDEAFGIGDAALSTIAITDPADLTVGLHTITRTIGGGTGQIALPGAGLSDVAADYFLLAVADPTDVIPETDLGSPGANNVAVFSGVYHAGTGPVVVQGTSANDSVSVSTAVTFAGWFINHNGTAYSYLSNTVSGLVARLHAGSDSLDASVFTSPVSGYGGIGNDALTGGGAADILDGGGDNDTIRGNGGDDLLTGGAGNDTYIFDTDSSLGSDTIDESAGGTDTLDFSATTTLGVAVNLGLATAQVVNGNLTLTLSSAATIENVIGGTQNDTLTGNSLSNVLTGGLGNDTYVFDTDSSLGSDTIDESAGGSDTLDFSATTTTGVAVNLGLAAAQAVNSNLTLTLGSAATIENVIGGTQNDVLTGNSLSNVLTGGLGNDTYVFDADSSLGSDTIDESAGGIDTLDFSATTTVGVAVNLGLAAAQAVNGNLTLTLGSAATIENVIGGTQNDTLTGNALNNALTGGAGNDTYVFDTDSSLGSDTIDESAGGTDTLDFSATTTVGLAVNLGLAAAQVVNGNLTLTLSSAATIENVTGGTQNDVLTGNALNNILTGGAGNDTYVFDTDSSLGSDTIDESAGGTDTLDFSSTTTVGVAVNLGLATAQAVNGNLTLTLGSATTIENVIGGTQNDTLTGNSLNNILTGGAGNDTYVFDTDSSLGSDTIDESAGGTDTLDFSATTTVGVAVNLGLAAAQAVNGNLTLTLGSAATIENVIGGTQNDTLTGNALNNILTGGAGNDTYVFDADSSLGSDTIDESAGGTDTLDFSATTTTGVAVNLGLAAAQVVSSNLTLTLSSAATIENVIGGTQNDTLTGNALNNVLTGGDGNDTLVVGAGNDMLTGGLGNDTYVFDTDSSLGSDTIDESAGGTDTLDFSSTTTVGVAVNLGLAAAQVVNSNLTLTLSSAATIENVIGGTQNDVLTGNALNNILAGGAGNDAYLFNADAPSGSDTLDESDGGTDTLDFSATTQGVTVNLGSAAAQVVSGNLTLTVGSATTFENLIGGAGNDSLTGNTLNNVLTGGAGNDSLSGLTGDDTFVFDADSPLGIDTVKDSGGSTGDTLDFSSTTTLGVTVNLSLATAQVVNTNLTLTLTAIENVIGGAQADTLTGSGVANVLVGGAGNDVLSGGGGNDTYLFDADTPLGSDTINESGGGIDTLDFSATTTLGISVNLGQISAQVVNANLTLTLFGTAPSIENVIGGARADTITGNSLANTLTGGAGDDLLTGNGGNDTYLFDTDTPLGSDTLNESGGGIDTLDFSATTDLGVTVNLGQATAQVVNANLTLTLGSASTFENVIGGGRADTLTGNALGNTLTGGEGDDLLIGGAGNDTYLFDADTPLGSDTLVEIAGEGTEMLDFSATTTLGGALNLGLTAAQVVNANLTLTLGDGGVFENASGSALDDVLTGNALANTLRGNNGNDLLIGGAGNDTLNGGAGDDTYLFNADSPLGSDTVVEATGGGTDTLDFSPTTSLGVSINLGVGTPQVVNNNLTLTLGTAGVIESYIGSSIGVILTGELSAVSPDPRTTAVTSIDVTFTGPILPTSFDYHDISLTRDGGANLVDGSVTASLVSGTTWQINGLGALTASGGTYVLTVNLAGITDLIGNAGQGTTSDTWIMNELPPVLPDIRVISTSADGGATLSVTYAIDNVASAPFDLGLYRSDDATFGSDVLLGTTPITSAVDLTVGVHTITRTIGSGAGQIALPGGGSAEIDSDYFLLIVADPNNAIAESDTGSPGANNVTLFSGVYHTAGGPIVVQGTDGVDTVSVNGAMSLVYNGTTYAYAPGDVSHLIAHMHGGDDSLTAATFSKPVIAFAGTGNDLLSGGTGNDLLTGGLGDDTYLFDADGTLGSDTIDESAGGTDTLDFSATTTLGVAVNLGLATAQVVNSNLTLTLGSSTTIENIIGGTQSDTLTGNALNNTFSGGAGNDTYLFDTDAALGSDTIDESGGGTDTLDFSATTTLGVTVSLGLASAQVANGNLTLTLGSATTIENVIGGTQNDMLTGNSLNNVLTGGAGNDVLTGGLGNDTYVFDTDSSLGSDTIDESAGGTDTLDFSATTTLGVAVNLGLAAAQVVNGNLTLTLGSPATIENVIGGTQNDTLTGNALSNVLTGGLGNDTYVFDADSSLGSDTIDESAGGIDTLDFSATTTVGVAVNLGLAAAQVVNGNLTLTLSSPATIENVIGGTQNDTLTGNALNNILTGGAGNDTYVFDTDSSLGSDSIDESAGGTDTLDFSATTTLGVAVNLGLAAAQVVNGNLALTLGSAATIENVIGGTQNDTLTGNALSNVLTGGLGNDTYVFDTDSSLGSDTIDESAGGTDTLDFSVTTTVGVAVNLGLAAAQAVNGNLTLTLGSAATIENVIGGTQNDTLTGSALNNVLTGGAGNDTYVFDADSSLGSDTIDESAGGTDTLDFSATTTVGVAINLGLAAAQAVNGNLTLTLGSAATIENVIGGTQNDTLTGNSLNNILTGGAGNDTYVFDTDSSLDSDTIDESAGGTDTLDFSATTTVGVAVNLGLAAAQAVNGNLTLTLGSAATIENVIGGTQNDTLTGSALNNVLTGGAGNDTYVFDADSSLGSDTIDESAGGIDTLDFSPTTTLGVAVNLGLAAAQAVNGNLTLTLSSPATIENVIGGTQNDTLTGNALNNVLTGEAGNDTYVFNADSQLGSDTLDEMAGGTDMLDFSATTQGVTVNLGTATAQVVNGNLTLTLGSATTFENLIGGAGNDSLTGNTLNNVLTGGAGNDSLSGLTGDDTFVFDADSPLGIDTVKDSGGSTGDTLDFSATTTLGVTVNLSLATAQVVNANLTLTFFSASTVENLIGGAQADTLTGSGVANVLVGGAGNDVLSGGGGNDTYLFDTDSSLGSDTINESGGGIDTLDFSATTTLGISVNLGQISAQVVNANLTLTLFGTAPSIENVIGGARADTITGNSIANTLTGGAGDDLLTGNGGNDTYSFNTDTPLGNDTLNESGGGIDTLDFSATTALGVTVNLGQATAQVVNANLTLTLGSASTFENVIGGGRADTLTGNALGNTLTGGEGDDLLIGGAGNDTYLFDADTPLGSDTLVEIAGEGTEMVDFSATTTLGGALNLGLTAAQVVNANLTLTLGDGGVFENASGSALDDVLTGNALANTLRGNNGNDLLIGGAGNDTLNGGAGDDTYLFNTDSPLGSDTVVEATGGGTDNLDFSPTTSLGVSINLGSLNSQVVNANLTLALSSDAAFEMVMGSSANDVILGNALNNVLFGGAGNDTLQGIGGRNLLVGGSGSDTLIGGTDDDLLISGLLSYYDESTKLLNRQAIDSVMAEWSRLDADYLTRIAELRAGGGLNGTFRIDALSVLTDGAPTDSLTGGTGLDWFWQFGGDEVADSGNGGAETTN